VPGEELLDLRCLVDFSSVECFTMQGRGVVSLSVVPGCSEAQFAQDRCVASQAQGGVSVSSSTGANVTAVVHAMSCGWVESLDVP
jgi:hypothetical protein